MLRKKELPICLCEEDVFPDDTCAVRQCGEQSPNVQKNWLNGLLQVSGDCFVATPALAGGARESKSAPRNDIVSFVGEETYIFTNPYAMSC